ncbi:hypothetical protein ANN_26870 [Periplaneta americana]|uniref:DDE Tnp4 domain-containing protein n=1 Tax=Periplaneta americana TaxID=6978 RepID=A0ABQ8RZX7_PERAM|nr:hypothetical protein ANN_26870 [Periplaneta americana]
MRPFPRNATAHDRAKQNYNKRLSTARRVAENAFDILAQKWRVFFRSIEFDIDSAIHVVKAACCLHNFIRNSIQHGTSEPEVEEDSTVMNQPAHVFSNIGRSRERSRNAAHTVRNHFVDYFSSLINN